MAKAAATRRAQDGTVRARRARSALPGVSDAALRNSELRRRYTSCPIACRRINVKVDRLSEFFDVFGEFLGGSRARESRTRTYWFRGHPRPEWRLVPSALRFRRSASKARALGLMTVFRRLAELRIPNRPEAHEDLKWIQIAQHHGLPTQLLDWTENPAVALYFACQDTTTDGMVFIVNPEELNRRTFPSAPRVLDCIGDSGLIDLLLKKGSKSSKHRRAVVAINPVLHNERILLQRGTFTLHGESSRPLDESSAPSLAYLPVAKESKSRLLQQLAGIGIDEMSIFPEPEHICRHLRTSAGLEDATQ